MCYTGSQASVSIYRQQHHHAAKWRSLRQPLQDRKNGREAWSGGLAMPRRLGHILCLPAATGGGVRGCWMRMPGKSHFYEAFPWSPRSPGGEGSSVSARSAGFLTVQPVSGQTRCDRSKALQRMALATLLRAESGQPPRWGYGRPRERRSKRRHVRHLGLVLYTLRDSG